MKVHIGPHKRDLISIRGLDSKYDRMRGYIDEDDYTWYDKIIFNGISVLYAIVGPINSLFRMRPRKVDIVIDDYDVWEMDYTLSLIILPMLKKLRTQKIGSATVDNEDVPKDLWSTNKPEAANNYNDDTVHARWGWVIDEMIWAFEQIADNENDEQFHSGSIDLQFKKLDSGHSQMVRGPNDTHVYDKDGHARHEKKISNGLRLFGKYYRGLWD